MNHLLKLTNQISLFNKAIIPLTNESVEHEAISVEISLTNVSLHPEHLEVSYDINQNVPLKIIHADQEYIIEYSDLNENALSLLDDLINEELQNNKWSLFDARNRRKEYNNELFQDLAEQIKNASSVEALYFKIHTDKIKYPNTIKDYILYTMLMEESNNVKDISIVEDFIENYFDIKYADLILFYPLLRQEYKDKFINNKNISPVVLDDYYLQYDELPDFNQVLNTHDKEQIALFYFKMWKNINYTDKSTVVFKLLNDPDTEEEILMDIHSRFDIEFLYDRLLIHPNCPELLINHYLLYPSYIKTIVKNPNLSDAVLAKILETNIDYNHIESVLTAILESANIGDENIKVVQKKMALLNLAKTTTDKTEESTNEWIRLLKEDSVHGLQLSLSDKILVLRQLSDNNNYKTLINLELDKLEAQLKSVSTEIQKIKFEPFSEEPTGIIHKDDI